MTLKFKACPKCQGDLQIKRDIYGMFINCLQCGLQRDLDAPSDAVEFARADKGALKKPVFEKLQRAA